MVRTLVLLLTTLFVSCATPPPPAAPTPPTTGACDDGALLGKASDTGRVECGREKACILGKNGPQCVARAEAELPEACGLIACGSGCSCSSAENSECLCAKVGAP